MILAIETSTRAFSVYIEENKIHANLEIVYTLTHSQGIVQTVDFMVKQIEREVNDIKEVYAGLGPGSFTGIRVGLSFVNTLSQVLDIPLAGATSLDILSYEVDNWKSPVIPFIRSRKDEVYTSFYKNGKRQDEFKVLKGDEFLDYVYNNAPDYLVSSEEDYTNIIDHLINKKINDKRVEFLKSVKILFSYPKAKYIPILIKESGKIPDKTYLKPVYVRGF